MRDLERFVARDGRQRYRGQARAGRPGEPAGGEVRVMTVARRQGPGGADRDPARHHHARHRRRAAPLLETERRRLPVGAAQGRGLPGLAPTRARAASQAAEHEILAAALRRPDPGARPADRLRRRKPRAPLRAQLVRLCPGAPSTSCRSRPFELDGGGRGLALWPGPDRRAGDRRAPDRQPPLAAAPGPAASRPPEPAARPLRLALDARRRRQGPGALAAGRRRRASAATGAATSSTGCCSCCPTSRPAARDAAARRLLARERDLTDGQRAEMAAAALAVLDDARFAAVFGPGSRAEVAVAGAAARAAARPGDLRPHRPPGGGDGPRPGGRLQDQPPGARRASRTPTPPICCQMALYVAVLGEIFPAARIEAALVWTDGPKLMPVPENLLAAAPSMTWRS